MTFKVMVVQSRSSDTYNKGRAGFGIAPILYLLAMVGVGAGVLFSGYGQILRSGQRVANNQMTKSELNAMATTLAASSKLDMNNLLLCPPMGGGAGSTCSGVADLTNVLASISGQAKLPAIVGASTVTDYENFLKGTTYSPLEVGVFKAGTAYKLLDPYGHFYIYCRWENPTDPSSNPDSSNPAFMVISAGPDGVLQTKCTDTAAKGDDLISTRWTVSDAINRAAVWQTSIDASGNPTQVEFGRTGTQLVVDAAGNLLTPGNITISTPIGTAAPGNLVVAGTSTLAEMLYAVGGLHVGTTTLSPLTIGTSGDISTTGSITATGGESITGGLTVHGDLTADDAGSTTTVRTLAVNAAATVATTLGVTQKATVGSLDVGSPAVLSIDGTNGTVTTTNGNITTTNGTITGSTLVAVSSSSLAAATASSLTVTGTTNLKGATNLGSTGQLSIDASGQISASGATVTIDNSKNLSAGATTLSSLTLTGNLTATDHNADFGTGTVTAAHFSGNINLGSGGGATLSGVVPLANGGTGYNASSVGVLLDDLFTNDSSPSTHLPLGRLGSNYIPGADIVSNSITSTQIQNYTVGETQLATTGIGAGTYGGFSVHGDGRIYAYSSPSTNQLNDGAGDTVSVGTTGVVIQSNSITVDDFNSSGWLGIGTAIPRTDLDVGALSGAVMLPVGTNGDRPATPYNGMIRYNSVSHFFEAYANNAWGSLVASVGTGGGVNSGVYLGTSSTITNPSNVNDVTTGLYTAGIGMVDISAAGTQVAEFNTGGLGIGTATLGTNAKLAVNGGVVIGTSFAGNAAPLDGMIVKGNVGIGTTMPAGTLDVEGGTATSGVGSSINLIAQTGYNNANASGSVVLTGGGNNASYGAGATLSVGGGNSNGGNITLTGGSYPAASTWIGGSITIMGGNGNTNAAGGAVTIQSGSTQNNGGANVTITSGAGNYSKSGSIYIVPGAAGSGGSGNVLLGVTSGGTSIGKVGIGSTSPQASLDLSQKTDAILLPQGSSDSPNVNGAIRYNSSGTPAVKAYVNGSWVSLLTGISTVGSGIVLGTSSTVPNPYASASDTQTGLYTAGAGKVDVTVSGSKIVEWSSSGEYIASGNVGIGTASPNNKFDVFANTSGVSNAQTQAGVRIDDGTSDVTLLEGVDNGTHASYIQSMQPNISWTTRALALQPMGGNVSIGTTIAPYPLTVGGAGSGLGVGWNKSGGNGETDFYNYGQYGLGGFAFWNYASSGAGYPTTGSTNLMTILSSGNVGIGTTAPANKLDVNGAAIFGSYGSTPTTAPSNGLAVSGGVGIGTATLGANAKLAVNGGLAVGTYANTATTASSNGIIVSGNLGIGSAAPQVSLDLSQRTDALALPIGTTGAEPASPANGMIRYNSSAGIQDIEAYINGYWTTLTTGGSGANIYLGTSVTMPDPAGSATDTTTGLYTAGAGKVDVTSSGTQVAEFNSSGLGIGTATLGTNAKLAVNGGVVIGTSFAGNAAPLDGMIVSGKVGIGTTSPTRLLDVNGVVGVIDSGIKNYNGGLSTESSSQLINFGMNDDSTNRFGGTYNSTSQGGVFRVDTRIGNSLFGWFGRDAGATSTVQTLMTLNSSGNVGIGTTAPGNKLDVGGAVAVGFTNGTVAPANGLIVNGQSKLGLGSANYLTLTGGTTGNAPAIAAAGTDTNVNLSLTPQGTGNTIFTSGNVGIGTATLGANAKLAVNGGLVVGSTYAGYAAPTNGMIASGSVGVGTTVPLTALDVAGTIYARSYNAGSATAIDWSQGNVQYTSASCGSFTFTNMQDGGSYQLFVEGTSSAMCSFSQTGLTFNTPPNWGPTTGTKMTVFSFTRVGGNVFVAWIPGY